MKYFSNFPIIKNVINGYEYNMVDITYAPQNDSEDYEVFESTFGTISNDIGLLSLRVYEDPNNFWALLFANDEINPWNFLIELPMDYLNRNKNFYGFFAKYSSSNKLNPDAHLTFKEDDIIIRGEYNNPGFTSASSIFTDYDLLDDNNYNLDTWVVLNAYSDTKKAKVTANLNVGNTGTKIIGEGESVLVLRKGSTGYYLVDNPFNPSSKTITTLKNYDYIKSPAFFSEIGKGDIILSPSVFISNTDTLITVMTNNGPDSPGLDAYENYSITTTKTFSEYEYFRDNKFVYFKAPTLPKILNKLI